MADKDIVYQEAGCYRFDPPDGRPYLVGSRCRKCGYAAFPSRVVCPVCLNPESMEEVSLGSRGRVDTFSVLHVGAPGFEAPYVVAYVLMPAGGRVFSLITGCEPSEGSLEIGTEVELVIEKIREDERGNEVRGFKFRPVGGGGKEAGPR
ncbi:MAG: Zn-ribbon domain-containing OB-fold protein [Nitrospinota bacterium]